VRKELEIDWYDEGWNVNDNDKKNEFRRKHAPFYVCRRDTWI
jgi:hypothetical protein